MWFFSCFLIHQEKLDFFIFIVLDLRLHCLQRNLTITITHESQLTNPRRSNRTQRSSSYKYSETSSRTFCHLCIRIIMDLLASVIQVNGRIVAFLHLYQSQEEFAYFQPGSGQIHLTFEEETKLAGISVHLNAKLVPVIKLTYDFVYGYLEIQYSVCTRSFRVQLLRCDHRRILLVIPLGQLGELY